MERRKKTKSLRMYSNDPIRSKVSLSYPNHKLLLAKRKNLNESLLISDSNYMLVMIMRGMKRQYSLLKRTWTRMTV